MSDIPKITPYWHYTLPKKLNKLISTGTVKMIIHIFENIPHHYHNFIKFFVNYCGLEFKHKIYIQSCGISDQDAINKLKIEQLNCTTVVYENHRQLIKLMKRESNSSRFIFHSLLNRRLWLKLLLSDIPKRSSWISWGADIYQYQSNNKNIKQAIAKIIHSITSKRMKYVKSLNPGDGELIRQLFGCNQIETLPYPLVGVEKPDSFTSTKHKKLTFLLGNSAAESNNHFELFDTIKHLTSEDILLLMPLNYAGKEGYIDTVIERGKDLFGDKFQPILEMLSKESYDKLLADVDITVFAHDRQQGLYVAYYMMLHGKKLFLKSTTTTYENFKNYNFIVDSLETLSQKPYHQLKQNDSSVQLTNQRILMENFTESALAIKWHEFFKNLSN
ncbi:TDP-N-acetylfucosamine:lipid II N-acetylfucosaminyltransferase [Shewanella baltica]|uniref:TDP-N-acetylfucosamine:lipid II N-acetylfucosaminyltransferase n=1 Tax=Shewanella baltica TaxID=62322 RepID=UPI0039AF73B3